MGQQRRPATNMYWYRKYHSHNSQGVGYEPQTVSLAALLWCRPCHFRRHFLLRRQVQHYQRTMEDKQWSGYQDAMNFRYLMQKWAHG